MPITQAVLDQNRRELLDLSARNRLLSIPSGAHSARMIPFFDERAAEIYRLLVEEKKALGFLPGKKGGKGESVPDSASELPELPQPDEEPVSFTTPAKRHVDSWLQTTLTSEGLQRRLLDLYRDAQTMIEEQGVNILYLAIGQLKWFELEKNDTPRYAPLILLPVELVRSSATDRFRLKSREEDIQENLSLTAKLKADFSLDLPPFSADEQFVPLAYLDAVRQAVASQDKWEVLPHAMTLGFFSFAKFLLYRDLEAKNWPNPNDLLANPFIASLLQDGFAPQDPPFPDDVHLDDLIPVQQLDHIVDADSSQTFALELARRGRSLVIQGPPGTGKSQSITNLIATAVLDGKRVLFVAEKLAALEVVKRRLEREGLGPVCLELHSDKASKRAVIEEIGRTWKLGRPKASSLEDIVPPLTRCREALNTHTVSLHLPLLPSGLAPYTLLGKLIALGERGRAAADLTFAEAENWTPSDLQERRGLVSELCERIAELGIPSEHPWRGCGRSQALKMDLDQILTRIRVSRERLTELQETALALATLLKQSPPLVFDDAAKLRRMGEHVAKAPTLDKQALCHGVWAAGVEGLREILKHGRTFAQAQAATAASVTDDVWTNDFRAGRGRIAEHGESLFRFFNGDYRRALAEVRSVSKTSLPKSYPEQLALLDQLISGQRAYQALAASEETARAAFGSVWKREKTDWNQVAAILDWIVGQQTAGLGVAFREVFAAINNPTEADRLAQTLAKQIPAAEQALSAAIDELKLDLPAAFKCSDLNDLPCSPWLARSALWMERIDDLTKWSNYFARAQRARALGLAPLVDRLAEGRLASSEGPNAFERIFYAQLLRAAARQRPDLGAFDGELHSRHVADFKKLDRDRLALAKFRVLAAHHSRLPASAGAGATGIVKSEMERKRGHRTVRRLLKDAGSVVQAIKPLFMMSPLSVAQFLEPGAVEFDLLVIDEASQVQPVDALGAIARCKQIVVVGDSRQLPPTRFFNRVTSDTPDLDENDEASMANARDVESILGLCRARGLPERMLRWHYRSRHHSLIAVSNHQFYDNQLFIVPSPWPSTTELGLKFHHVPDAIFDRGGTGTNRIEAKAVGRAVIAHARRTPHLSLGVAAFSLKQQQAILDELELLRRENADTESFFADNGVEPFFVKNLENVQGDERDVIFISVGYGRDHSGGVLSMNFGPLGSDGGERRMNVLISRAKQRCEVFSSITSDEIDLVRAKGRGVHSLKTFLSFAQSGKLSVAESGVREEQSPFEVVVRNAIAALGHDVRPQVGLAGFFIDLAIVGKDGRYVLGVECDGASYHASRSARERDRLRQAVLEDHGWRIYRLWSTDWFQGPVEQLAKLRSAIEAAKIDFGETTLKTGTSKKGMPAAETPIDVEREFAPPFEAQVLSDLAKPYSEARFAVPLETEPHALPPKDLEGILLKIVRHEGPVHEDELSTRVRELWNLPRIGSRLQDAVARSVRSLLVSQRCRREDNCLIMPDADVPIRNREEVTSANLRKPDFLPSVEVRAAILLLVDTLHGVSKDDVPTAVARVLGFKTTTAPLRTLIEAQTERLISLKLIEEQGELLRKTNRATLPT